MNTQLLAEDIKKFRTENNLGRRKLALMCNVSLSTIQNMEDEIIRNPKPEVYCKICDVMVVDPQKYF